MPFTYPFCLCINTDIAQLMLREFSFVYVAINALAFLISLAVLMEWDERVLPMYLSIGQTLIGGGLFGDAVILGEHNEKMRVHSTRTPFVLYVPILVFLWVSLTSEWIPLGPEQSFHIIHLECSWRTVMTASNFNVLAWFFKFAYIKFRTPSASCCLSLNLSMCFHSTSIAKLQDYNHNRLQASNAVDHAEHQQMNCLTEKIVEGCDADDDVL